MILPNTVGNVAGLVVDADGLVTRDVGESDVVIRLVIPGWRRVGKSSFMMSCSFEGKLAIRDRWLSVPLPPGQRVSGRRWQRQVVLFRSFQVVDLTLQSVNLAEEWLQIGPVLLTVLLELLFERRFRLAGLPCDLLSWSRRRQVDVLVLLVVVLVGVLLLLSQVTASNLLVGQTNVTVDDVCPLTSSLVS